MIRIRKSLLGYKDWRSSVDTQRQEIKSNCVFYLSHSMKYDLPKFSEHISVFLGHPVVMYAQSPSLLEEIDIMSSCQFCTASVLIIRFLLQFSF